MLDVSFSGDPDALNLDVCTHCQSVWFDVSEYEKSPHLPAPPSKEKEPDLPPEAIQEFARFQARMIAENARDRWSVDYPDSPWMMIPAALGLPVEVDAEVTSPRPWVVWLLSFTICVVSITAFFDLGNVIHQYGFIPAQIGRYGGLTLISSFFLHGGVFHLVTNMYFLLVFGDNVEDDLGKARFILLIFIAAVAGSMIHYLGDPRVETPCVGASGGISGIIAYYSLRYPHAKLGMLFRFGFYYFRWFCAPAFLLFFLWFALQIFGAVSQISGFGSTSCLAHLGGAVVGMIFWVLKRK